MLFQDCKRERRERQNASRVSLSTLNRIENSKIPTINPHFFQAGFRLGHIVMASRTQIYDPDGDITLILDEKPRGVFEIYEDDPDPDSEVHFDNEGEENGNHITSETSSVNADEYAAAPELGSCY
jgi:hypothetical protein